MLPRRLCYGVVVQVAQVELVRRSSPPLSKTAFSYLHRNIAAVCSTRGDS